MSKIDRFVQEEEPRQVVTVNLQFMSLARKNEAFLSIVNRADMVVADGMPLVWVSKMKGAPIASRVTGHDILHECAELASKKGYSMFLLGGAPR
ncbi:MAG: WecB/TagA/CpsF family glycosyltransferase [Chloroflexi bacterium]|nr:WecB/TagA/CpsF family glycosyltransferase [Chloroflexota bacterium]